MTEKEKNIKLAKLEGWIEGSCGWWTTPDGVSAIALPDYFNDLDAIHKAEKIMTMEQCAIYEKHLQNADALPMPAGLNVWHATAAQRANALGETLNLW